MPRVAAGQQSLASVAEPDGPLEAASMTTH